MFKTNSLVHEVPIRKHSNYQNVTLNLQQPLRKRSVTSLSQINKYYQDFQYALNMLKTSVGELWQLELDQLGRHQITSSSFSNTKVSTDVPSIYNCRPVLPIDNEIVEIQKSIRSTSNSIIVVHHPSSETNSIRHSTNTNDEKLTDTPLQPSLQSFRSREKSRKSLLSVDKKQRLHGRGDHITKYCTKRASLHLKFRCSKHLQ